MTRLATFALLLATALSPSALSANPDRYDIDLDEKIDLIELNHVGNSVYDLHIAFGSGRDLTVSRFLYSDTPPNTDGTGYGLFAVAVTDGFMTNQSLIKVVRMEYRNGNVEVVGFLDSYNDSEFPTKTYDCSCDLVERFCYMSKGNGNFKHYNNISMKSMNVTHWKLDTPTKEMCLSLDQ